jgi:hypothetical protein
MGVFRKIMPPGRPSFLEGDTLQKGTGLSNNAARAWNIPCIDISPFCTLSQARNEGQNAPRIQSGHSIYFHHYNKLSFERRPQET